MPWKMGRKGWPGAGAAFNPASLPAYLPQWIPAGAWVPLSTNTYKGTTDLEYTGANNIVFNSLRFDLGTSDQWHFVTLPPLNWTTGKITFIPHYIVHDSLGTPQNMVFELGAEFIQDGFLPDATTAFQTITSTKIAGVSTVPQYIIGTESAELTLTGSPADTGAIALRMKRGSDSESDPLYFTGVKLLFV